MAQGHKRGTNLGGTGRNGLGPDGTEREVRSSPEGERSALGKGETPSGEGVSYGADDEIRTRDPHLGKVMRTSLSGEGDPTPGNDLVRRKGPRAQSGAQSDRIAESVASSPLPYGADPSCNPMQRIGRCNRR